MATRQYGQPSRKREQLQSGAAPKGFTADKLMAAKNAGPKAGKPVRNPGGQSKTPVNPAGKTKGWAKGVKPTKPSGRVGIPENMGPGKGKPMTPTKGKSPQPRPMMPAPVKPPTPTPSKPPTKGMKPVPPKRGKVAPNPGGQPKKVVNPAGKRKGWAKPKQTAKRRAK